MTIRRHYRVCLSETVFIRSDAFCDSASGVLMANRMRRRIDRRCGGIGRLVVSMLDRFNDVAADSHRVLGVGRLYELLEIPEDRDRDDHSECRDGERGMEAPSTP